MASSAPARTRQRFTARIPSQHARCGHGPTESSSAHTPGVRRCGLRRSLERQHLNTSRSARPRHRIDVRAAVDARNRPMRGIERHQRTKAGRTSRRCYSAFPCPQLRRNRITLMRTDGEGIGKRWPWARPRCAAGIIQPGNRQRVFGLATTILGSSLEF